MKVLFVSNMFPTKKHIYYGIHVKEQIDGLKKQFGLDTFLYFINALDNGKIEYIKAVLRIRKTILRFDPDVIHIHYGLSGLFLLFFKPKCKIFLTLHGGDILPKQGKYLQLYLTKKILKKVDKALILNEEMAEILSKLKIPFEVIPCGVDIDYFKPDSSYTDNGNISKAVVFPGDPSRQVKNYPLFEETIKILKTLVPYNLEIKVVHNLDRQEVVRLLCSSDCLVMTSFSEGSPQIIKEALSCNLPVISVNVGDVKDVVDNLPGCFVTVSRSAKELAEAISKSFTIDASDLREKFKMKGLYDNNSIFDRLYKIYKD